MDPFLEGMLWPDLHHSLAYGIRKLLASQLPDHYTAQIEVAVAIDEEPEREFGIMYPDVEVVRQNKTGEPPAEYITPASLNVRETIPVELRLSSVKIRNRQQQQLITSIEILSPVNKRGKGAEEYRLKRQKLKKQGVHLLEIDLLRRGQRAVRSPKLPACDYLISLHRANCNDTALWTLQLKGQLPTVPVPLRPPDKDIALPLGSILHEIYDEARYDKSIDYTEIPPPPGLSPAGEQLLKSIRNSAV